LAIFLRGGGAQEVREEVQNAMETLDAKLAERSLIREKKACIDRSQHGRLVSESFPLDMSPSQRRPLFSESFPYNILPCPSWHIPDYFFISIFIFSYRS
jgi:hypothetical protein